MPVCTIVYMQACVSLGEKNILGFDIGGWTFNISVLNMDNGDFIHHLTGRTMD